MKPKTLKFVVSEILLIGFMFFISGIKLFGQQKIELCEDFIIKNYTIKAENGSINYVDIKPNLFYQFDGNNIIVKYDKVGTFVITANANNGACDVYKHIVVEVVECTQTVLYIPNSFTPKGQNPIFRLYGININNYKLQIWNRWGELLFTSDDINIGWDGYYKGNLSPSGIYPGKVNYTDNKGTYKEQYFKINLI